MQTWDCEGGYAKGICLEGLCKSDTDDLRCAGCEGRSGWVCNSGGESSTSLRTSASTVHKYRYNSKNWLDNITGLWSTRG